MTYATAMFTVFLLIGCAPALAQYDQQMRQQQMRQLEDEQARQQNEIRRMQEQQRQMEQRQLDSQPRTGLWVSGA
jgi:hypothetical protein